MSQVHWNARAFGPTDLHVGACAWHVSLLLEHPGYVFERPSLIVATPEDDEALLSEAGRELRRLPVLLGVSEPAFARQLRDVVLHRIAALGRERVEAVALWVNDPTELKGGGMLQSLFALREEGRIGHIGLVHPDPRMAEWLTIHTAVRIVGTRYGLGEQSPRYRMLPSAGEYGMACLSIDEPEDEASLRFALAEAHRALPLMRAPVPDTIHPMTTEEVDAAWERWQQERVPPAPLPRSMPPDAAG